MINTFPGGILTSAPGTNHHLEHNVFRYHLSLINQQINKSINQLSINLYKSGNRNKGKGNGAGLA